MKLIWATDVHLNFLGFEASLDFLNVIKLQKADGLILSGDIAESHNIYDYLIYIYNQIKIPIYFVCGNHDFYGSSVQTVRQKLKIKLKPHKDIYYLTQEKPIELKPHSYIVGVDSFADARNGNKRTPIRLNDQRYVGEFTKTLHYDYNTRTKALFKEMQRLADNDARRLQRKLNSAIQLGAKKIICVTHVPALVEACKYNNHTTSNDFLPFYSSKALEKVYIKTATNHKDIHFIALAGHTHNKAYGKIFSNLTYKTGESNYFYPKIEEIIKL